MPRPSSVTSTMKRSPLRDAWMVDRSRLGLAGGAPLLGRLDPVVERVAHEMQQRLEQTIDDGLVGLRRLAAGQQA